MAPHQPTNQLTNLKVMSESIRQSIHQPTKHANSINLPTIYTPLKVMPEYIKQYTLLKVMSGTTRHTCGYMLADINCLLSTCIKFYQLPGNSESASTTDGLTCGSTTLGGHTNICSWQTLLLTKFTPLSSTHHMSG